MAVLEGLEPRGVLHWFEELCRIPHGSGNTQALSDYLVQFGRDRGPCGAAGRAGECDSLQARAPRAMRMPPP